ncbi:MAG: hypothetical protein ACLT2T_13320 [Bilophila wadsworthia]
MHNLDFMLQTLVNLALHYPQAGRTPAQLRILAEDWAEDLAAFPRDIVERAVKAHRRESPYFPTVADIWRRCEELRRGLEARREAERALPGRTLTRDEQIALNTDWCAKSLRTCGGRWSAGNGEAADARVTRACACGAFRAGKLAVAEGRGTRGWGCGARRGWRGPGPEPCGTGNGIRKQKGGVMGELWVNYAELADAIGEDGAEKLCRAVGGVSTYIPRTQPEGSPLCGVIGMERMRRLCSAFGGLRVTLPNRRRSEPSKVRIARLLESGKAPGAVALEIGVTERYVRMIASRCKIGSGGSGGRGSVCRPD